MNTGRARPGVNTTSALSTGAAEQMRNPLAQGWRIMSTSLAELFVEVEMVMWKLLLEPDVYVIFHAREFGNRFVQAVIDDDEEPGIWCETVADTFLGTPEHGPPMSPTELAALLRDGWLPPSGSPDDTPNWHRLIPADMPGAPALASQLLVSALIDVHNVAYPDQITVSVGARSR